MLTKEQKTRLAKEAEKLAMECVEGTAPDFGRWAFYSDSGSACVPVCAVGHAIARAGIPLGWDIICDIRRDTDVNSAAMLAADANNEENQDALPWALLSFADALKESARK